MNISVVGLGKLGLPLAATIASKGFFVLGVDINKKVVDELNQGRTSLNETNLANLINKYKKNIKATTEIKEAILNSEITFIITPTPSLENGYFSLQYLTPVIKEIAKVLKEKSKFHLVCVVSTIMPGSMDQLKVLLEGESGKKCNKDFGLCYSPEFIALGSVIQNLLNPDFLLIGESDKKSGDILQSFYKKYCDNKPKIARMNFVNAELSKISVNTFITTKISYANMLAEICEKLPGGDVDLVTLAIGLDSRIGRKYLKGGAAFGGPCFPRDNVAFISLAKNLKATLGIPQATHNTNLRQITRLKEKVLQHWSLGKTVGILGLSYKPFTDVIDESSGLLLTKALRQKQVQLNLYDPVSLPNAKRLLGKSGVNYIKDLKDCIEKSDILIITTNWPEFEDIPLGWFGTNPKVIIDPWRMFNLIKLPKTVKYIPFGLNLISD